MPIEDWCGKKIPKFKTFSLRQFVVSRKTAYPEHSDLVSLGHNCLERSPDCQLTSMEQLMAFLRLLFVLATEHTLLRICF